MSFLPKADRDYLDGKGYAYEEREENGQKAIILKRRPLPAGRFDSAEADILVLLPGGYPDCAPDMFHLLPWVRLTNSNSYPKAADQPVNFAGQSWQRWSRHNNEWRPGVDGIWTMLKRIEDALEKAA
jgi:hypothetical protein